MSLFRKIFDRRRGPKRVKNDTYTETCNDCGEWFVAARSDYIPFSDSNDFCGNCQVKRAAKKREGLEELEAKVRDKKSERCNNCKYWIPRYGEPPVNWPFWFETSPCHGEVPKPGSPNPVWPETKWNDQCGKFKTRHTQPPLYH